MNLKPVLCVGIVLVLPGLLPVKVLAQAGGGGGDLLLSLRDWGDSHPAVAYNGNGGEFLVAWEAETGGIVSIQRLSAGGAAGI